MENNKNEEYSINIFATLEYAKAIDAKIYSNEDKEKATIVANDFKETKSQIIKSHVYKHFTNENLVKMFYTCINTYALFDDDFLINRINDYLMNTPIIDGRHTDDSLFQVLYKPVLENNEYIKVPTKIIIPSDLNNKTAGHYLVHTMAHILKNSNNEEEKLFMTYSNVIPNLLELISAYESSPLETKEVFKKKQDFIIKTTKIYNTIVNQYDKNSDEHNIILAISGHYLTSFYYALGLFYEYLQKPYSILEDVDDVLECEATTLDVIEEHIDNNNHEKYQKGLAKFKKLTM